MIQFASIRRIIRIRNILFLHGLDGLLPADGLPLPRWLMALGLPTLDESLLDQPRSVRIRLALQSLGPIFVKFGQTLSTRRDLLPDDIALELVKLQDRVPAFPGVEARQIVEASLGKPVTELFLDFEEEALASASVAQVHGATLPSGESVVVKVLRPGIDEQIKEDLALMEELARLLERFWPESRRLKPEAVVAEFGQTILDELDLVREASNAAEMRRNFESSDSLYIPKVYFSYTRRDVMVMERISGIPIGNVEELRRVGVDLELLAARGVEIFFTQVLRDSFFHADMHPGNIFVTPEAKYIAIDFGIVGSISEADKRYIAENFRAFFNRDYRRVAEMHIASGWVARDTRVTDFEGAIRAVCEPIFEKPLKEISYGHLLLRLFQVARRFDMEVQPQLVLLQKTLLNIEGLGRDLYPDLDLWKTAAPFLERWFKQELGPMATLNRIKDQVPFIVEQFPELPVLVHKALLKVGNDKFLIEFESRELIRMRELSEKGQKSTLRAITGGVLLILATLLMGHIGTGGGLILLAFGAILLVSAWF